RRPHEGDPRLLERRRECRVFREEPVSRMHRLGAGRLAGRDDLLDRQVTVARRGRPDMDGLVGHLHMQRLAVGIGIDSDGTDAEALCGLDDPAGDLATIGDEETFEHAHSGMLSCFLVGTLARFLRSVSKARMTRRRVLCGRITSSMKPRSAATKGLAKRASYSAVRCAILSLSLSSAR